MQAELVDKTNKRPYRYTLKTNDSNILQSQQLTNGKFVIKVLQCFSSDWSMWMRPVSIDVLFESPGQAQSDDRWVTSTNHSYEHNGNDET